MTKLITLKIDRCFDCIHCIKHVPYDSKGDCYAKHLSEHKVMGSNFRKEVDLWSIDSECPLEEVE